MEIQSVLSVAPLRISFLGGGTDIANFYEKHSGGVVSCAINKYVYVHIKRHDPLFQEKYRISYSDVEHTSTRDSIKNSIVRSCLELLDMDEPLQISTSGDLPSNSGLGSSSSFCVALLASLHALKGENVSSAQLAEEACSVEINFLGSPIGKQDQYASAFGGMNYLHFGLNGKVGIEPILAPVDKISNFMSKIHLFWTGLSRDANSILNSQAKRESQNTNLLLDLNSVTNRFRLDFEMDPNNFSNLGELITQGWSIKKNLEPSILTAEISDLEEKLRKLNPLGYKLLGAGGGGFFLTIFDNPGLFESSNLSHIPKFNPKIDNFGARVLSII